MEKLIPGATTALGILYLGKPSEKLPTDAVNQRWFQLYHVRAIAHNT
ncbi:hypothetical protein [Microcoleus sp. OTE_8_concoct_300]